MAEAESKLPELPQMLEIGETVAICRDRVAVARLVQAEPKPPPGPRKLGALKGKIVRSSSKGNLDFD